MDDCERTLVVFLSMHRCGSSFTTSTLQSLGMYMGPFDLNEASPSNPYGHFRAMPFLQLNRRIQELALGFPDDLPTSPAVLSRFWQTQGEWSEGFQIPDEFLEEGRSLVRTLVDSGKVSGFKDPRTVLTWPFWERIFKDFPGLRIVPVSLLRSPHEIAMSLVTRRNGWCGYWNSLDVVAVHLRRQKAILASRAQPSPGLCFGSPSFLEDLALVTRQCGLTWNREKALEAFDQSCVHQTPAAVEHEAQDAFDALCHQPTPRRDAERDRRQLVKDARFLEALRLQQWQSVEVQRQAAAAVQRQSVEVQLSAAQEGVWRARMGAEEISLQLRETEVWLFETRLELVDAQRELVDAQRELIETQRSRREVQERLVQSQARESQARRDNEALRSRVDRIESHPLLGTAMRVRRRMREKCSMRSWHAQQTGICHRPP